MNIINHIPKITCTIFAITWGYYILFVLLSGGNIFFEPGFKHDLKYLMYSIICFLLLSYVEINLGMKNFIIFLLSVYAIRIISSLSGDYGVCSNTSPKCIPNITIMSEVIDITVPPTQLPVPNLLMDGLLIPAIAAILVIFISNSKNNIFKIICILVILGLYFLIFYLNKNISYKDIYCNEKEKICYTFLSESLIYAVSVISSFIIVTYL